jgi:uncharacterized SAM-binding protein YcdF (DUF218 family)
MRARRKRLIAVLVAAVAAFAAGYPVYVSPTVDPISPDRPADAVVALGGDPRTGPYAQQLVTRGLARTLVLSDPYDGWPNSVTALCREAADRQDGSVLCFDPNPRTTRGEARAITRLAADHGWRDVIVVVPIYHVSRARMIVQRCFVGDLAVIETPDPVPPWVWIYQYGYQTAGYLKAAILQRC